MSAAETRIAARSTSGVEVYYQHSTLPTKENVEAYEAFHKGAAKIMLDMAVEDQRQYWIATHRKAKIDGAVKLVGIVFCFLLCLLLIGCGTYLMATNHYATGSASVLIALIALLGTLASGGAKAKAR